VKSAMEEGMELRVRNLTAETRKCSKLHFASCLFTFRPSLHLAYTHQRKVE